MKIFEVILRKFWRKFPKKTGFGEGEPKKQDVKKFWFVHGDEQKFVAEIVSCGNFLPQSMQILICCFKKRWKKHSFRFCFQEQSSPLLHSGIPWLAIADDCNVLGIWKAYNLWTSSGLFGNEIIIIC